jgi:DNA mismatch repair protein PMS2
LNFGTNGSIISEIQVARTTGTTVTGTNLFEALPVRRGEFLRSIKKQYQKMIKVLQSYAIIAVGVRILVTNAGKVS